VFMIYEEFLMEICKKSSRGQIPFISAFMIYEEIVYGNL